jgi:hypothetical protein
MAVGDLTASTPVYATGGTAIKTAIDDLNLAAATDFVFVVPIAGRDNQYMVFKVERAAA